MPLSSDSNRALSPVCQETSDGHVISINLGMTLISDHHPVRYILRDHLYLISIYYLIVLIHSHVVTESETGSNAILQTF